MAAAAAAVGVASTAASARADEFTCATFGAGCSHAGWAMPEAPDDGADIGVSLSLRYTEDRTDVGASVGLGLPLWRWLGDPPSAAPDAGARAVDDDDVRSGARAPDDDDGARGAALAREDADASALASGRDEGAHAGGDGDRDGQDFADKHADDPSAGPSARSPSAGAHKAKGSTRATRGAQAARARKGKGAGRARDGAPLMPSHAAPRISADDARAAVAAARQTLGSEDANARLDDLASRARWSAALPELRLRATRLVEESQGLSPTEYDAARTTASDGVSLWLEARASWHLDRALFADEEVRIERMRAERAAAADRRAAEVLRLLFAWQRAAFMLLDDAATADVCWDAWLEEQELAAALAVVTGGWFERWRAERDGRAADSEPVCAGRPLAPLEATRE